MGQFGKQKPRHKFFLNPHQDARFTRCPNCDAKTKLRKFPLVIHLKPAQVITLNKTCRYCPGCDLIIAHQDKLEEQLTIMCIKKKLPEMIGNEYFVFGTMTQSNWRRNMKTTFNLDEFRAAVRDFKSVWEFEAPRYEWVLDEDAKGSSKSKSKNRKK